MSSTARARLTPQMAEYDRMGVEWLPYLMYVQRPGYRSEVVNTDRFGLRLTVGPEGRSFALEDLEAGECDLLVGGSTSFGVGASSDAATLASVLSQRTGRRWLNLGGRAYSPLQELLLYMLHRPRLAPAARIVLLSGLNAIVLHLLSTRKPDLVGGMFFWQQLEGGIREATLTPGRRRLKAMLGPWLGGRIDWARVPLSRIPLALLRLERRFDLPHLQPPTLGEQVRARLADRDGLVEGLARDLRHWRLLAADAGAELSYVLQPFFDWTGKQPSPEEELLFAELDRMPKNHILALKAGMDFDVYLWLADRLETICRSEGIRFLDMNRLLGKRAARDDWLFVDRAHLTDLGNRRVAEILGREGVA